MTDDFVPVTRAVIRKDGLVLIARRKRAYMGYLWEFPGGEVSENETLQEGLVRLLREDFGIDGEVTAYLCSSGHVVNCQLSMKSYVYEVACVPGDFVLKDHQEVRWVAAEDLVKYDFAEPDHYVSLVLMGKR